MVKGVTVIEARIDEGSGYCGSGGGIKGVSEAAKIANMVMTHAGKGGNLLGERPCRVKYETEIFGRQAGHYGFGGREGEREVLTIYRFAEGDR